MPANIQVKYFNSFWLKKTVQDFQVNSAYEPIFPGLEWEPAGYPPFPGYAADDANLNWIIEEARIRGGYNNTSTDYGVRAYMVDNTNLQSRLGNTLIYSGIFNARTDINQTNVFSTAEEITRSVDPAMGSIQKLYAENTNLIIFQENKVNGALIDKDAIYSAEGSALTTTAQVVIGQITPYVGEFGISQNPESFAKYGFRKYFTDVNRGSVLRLSRDGLTEISNYGMSDYFRDNLATISSTWQANYTTSSVVDNTGNITDQAGVVHYFIDITLANEQIVKGMTLVVNNVIYKVNVEAVTNGYTRIYLSGNPGTIAIGADIAFVMYEKDRVVGVWDIHQENYVVSLQKAPINQYDDSTYSTVSFDEGALGWTSFYTYRPIEAGSIKNIYYTFNDAKLWQHYYESPSNDNRNNFYGVTNESNVTLIFNPNPSVTKNYNTISYEGSSGWEVDSIEGDIEQANREWTSTGVTNNFIENQDTTKAIYSFLEGTYEVNTPANTGINAVTPPFAYAGFTRKENRYVSNIINNSVARSGEVIFGDQMSGIKGYFATVKVSTDTDTEPGGMKELFAVSSNYVMSSY